MEYNPRSSVCGMHLTASIIPMIINQRKTNEKIYLDHNIIYHSP